MARVGEKKGAYRVLVGVPERENFKYLSVYVRIILNIYLKGVFKQAWTRFVLVQDRKNWRDFAEKLVNFWVP